MVMTKNTRPAMSIGAFSQATRLSVRMLRHYAQRGILEPDHVDDSTGYRYYTAAQIGDGVLVRAMRDIGLPISAMVSVLRHRDDPDALSEALTAHRDQLDESRTKLQDQLRATERLLAQMKEPSMTITTSIDNHDAMNVVALRDTLATYPDEGRLWQQLMPLMGQAGVKPIAAGGVTYLDEEFKDADIDAEIWVPIASTDAAVPAPAEVKQRPAMRVVVATVRGAYEQIPDGFAAAAAHLEENGLKAAGTPYMRYLADPSCTPDPADYVTEVCLPVE